MARMTRSVCWQSAVAPSSPFREEQAVGLSKLQGNERVFDERATSNVSSERAVERN